MPIVTIPVSQIDDWDSFHVTFADSLGFPEFYGRNMNAWIEDRDEPDGMSSVVVGESEVLTLQLDEGKAFAERCPELYMAVLHGAAFVNWRRIDMGLRPIIAVASR